MPLKVVFVSNLFPDRDEPYRGLVNAKLLHQLSRVGGADIRVVSPRPQIRSKRRAPRQEDLKFHPEFPATLYVPKWGSRWNDSLLKRSISTSILNLLDSFQPDALVASWLFPDGCGLALLCEALGLPFHLIAQGSDTHGYLNNPIRKQKIVTAVSNSASTICRSEDLANRLHVAGAPFNKLRVIYNGVDSEVFFPIERAKARDLVFLKAKYPVLLFVGNLLPVKDPLFLLDVHAQLNKRRKAARLPPALLYIIGEGPLRGKVEATVKELGTEDEVFLLGEKDSKEISLYMNASNVLCLTSQNEGFPNVILEAMACKLPIVSSDVGGISERVNRPDLGTLVPRKDLNGFVLALEATLNKERRGSLNFDPSLSWIETIRQYVSVLEETEPIAKLQG